jgi:nitrate reductase beta subunit
VDRAIEEYSCPDRELLAVLQLFRAQRQILFRFTIDKGPKIAEIPVRLPSGKERIQEIFNDTVRGFNQRNEEVVRLTIEEPTFERPKEHHVNSI